jgi:hypothetical protein
MDYGKIKKGDTVKFSAKAKKEIPLAVDDQIHIVAKVDTYSNGSEHVDFKDGGGSDVFWLTLVAAKKKSPLKGRKHLTDTYQRSHRFNALKKQGTSI